jgi:hypothetical protein
LLTAYQLQTLFFPSFFCKIERLVGLFEEGLEGVVLVSCGADTKGAGDLAGFGEEGALL